MGTQYCCANENRREQVRKTTDGAGRPVLNGIDYLEVVSEDEKTLKIHFIHNLPGQPGGFPDSTDLKASNFVIEGGVRITGIKVKEPIAVAGKVVTLQVDGAGDYSAYILRLVTDEEDGSPPAGFDAQLSAIRFSFKVECPSDFDCKVEETCPPDSLPTPVIDYLAKDYASFRRLMLDRLSVLMPDWKERHPADLQVALVEAVAYVGDHLSYYQDAVGTEAYLGTARQRISVRRHARLLDYAMHDGCNARAWVHFEIEAGSAAEGYAVPAGTPLLTRGVEDASTVDPADYERILQQEAPSVFETLRDTRNEPPHEVVLRSAHNGILFYTWDDTECCLPKGATRATLYNDPQLHLQTGDVLLFEEVTSPATGLDADADPSHRCFVRLTNVVTQDSNGDPLRDPLHGTPIAEIAWHARDALPFPLCLSAEVPTASGPQLKRHLSVARGNIVLADHGRTIEDEALGSIARDASGRPKAPVLKVAPVTQQGHARDRYGKPVRGSEGEVVVFDPEAAAVAAFEWEMREVLPAVRLIENGDTGNPWLPRHDLLSSHRFDRHFVVEIDNEGIAHLRFGDGFHGMLPKPDSKFTAVYRVGNGAAGNIGADTLRRAVLPVTGIKRVRNPLPASHGREPESLEEVRQYAPQAFRTPERAVTREDYATVTERHPDVQKAAATLRWTGSWYTVFDTVDRMGGGSNDAAFKADILAFVDRFRLAGQDIEIDNPRFVPLEIIFTICVKPGYYRSQVKEDLLKRFSNKMFPDGTRGFFHPDNFTFGQPVYLSRMIALAMNVPGVQWVDAEDAPGMPNRFRRWGQSSQGEFAAGKISFGRLEIARLDNDPSLPENGKLDFLMEGGL